jgi:hypothetical protein
LIDKSRDFLFHESTLPYFYLLPTNESSPFLPIVPYTQYPEPQSAPNLISQDEPSNELLQ